MKNINIDIEKNTIINIFITIISFLATCYIPYIINVEGKLAFSNNIISLVVFITFICLLKKTFIEENYSKIKNVSFLSFMFSTFLILGNRIDTYHTINYKDLNIYLAIFIISIIIDALLVWCYRFVEKIELKEGKLKQIHLKGFKRYLIIFCVIILCWIPVFLSAYPGYFCYDALTQFKQYNNNKISTWHPPLHTFLLGFIVSNVGNITASYNIGIATYTIIQMIIIDVCFTYCIYFLEKFKVANIIKIISIIYFAIFPVVVMFSMCSTKDSFFSAIVLLSIIIALEALLEKEKFINSKWLQIRFILVIFLAIILRNNAIYAYIPFLILFSLFLKNKKSILLLFAIALLFGIYLFSLQHIFGIKDSQNADAFSVPIQQIARVYNYNFDSLTQDELDEIFEYTTDTQLKIYNSECADNVKYKVDISKFGYQRFLDLWIHIGMKNPGIYIDSFLENTIGYWFPNTIVDGYTKDNILYQTETSYFAAMCEPPGEMESKIPFINKIYYDISRETIMQQMPVISMLFSPGAMAWILLICIGYTIYKKRKEICIALSIIVLLWLTVLLGPIVLVRYVLIMFFAFPLIIAFLFNGNKFETKVQK